MVPTMGGLQTRDRPSAPQHVERISCRSPLDVASRITTQLADSDRIAHVHPNRADPMVAVPPYVNDDSLVLTAESRCLGGSGRIVQPGCS